MTRRAAPSGRPRSPERTALRDATVAVRTILEEDAASRSGAREAVFAWTHLVAAASCLDARGLLGGGGRRIAAPSAAAFLEIADREIGGRIAAGARARAPGSAALGRAAARFADPALAATWLRDEAIGDVFQAFSLPERRAAFERLSAGAALDSHGLRAATQIFTPRWIVRALIENSIGRLWLEMHPDSRLAASMPYLHAARAADAARAAGPARRAGDIAFLDPACGAMHFGLAAFDLFEAMHEEEIENAGRAGWPSAPSAARGRVAATILERNLAGADVDPRAIEIAGLALRLRARRSAGSGVGAPRIRLGVAGDAGSEIGSLGRLPAGLERAYDVVATNPPYLGRRHVPTAVASVIKRLHPEARGDLCAAFVLRALGLLAPGGRAALLAQQSFLFTSGYERLRQAIRSSAALESVVHLGTGAFDEIGGEKVNSALVVFRAERAAAARESQRAVFVRVCGEKGPEEKEVRLRSAAERLRAGRRDPAVFRARLADFDAVPGRPWAYALATPLRPLFARARPLAAVADVCQGLATTDNKRFVRHWCEVGHAAVAWDCSSAEAARTSGKRWFPYAKGGGARRFDGRIDLVVDWENDGESVKREIVRRYPYLGGRWEWVAKNTDRYFRGGITYSALSTGRFSARILPAGCVFDVSGSAVFAHGGEPDELFLLGVLNSSVAGHILAHLNPTVNVQVGDVGRLPLPPRRGTKLVDLAAEALSLARRRREEDETDPVFVEPPAGAAAVRDRERRLAEVESRIDREVARLYGLRPATAARIAAPRDRAEDETDEAGVAHRQVSYAVGIALGRYVPGEKSGPGRGRANGAEARALARFAARAGLAPAGEPGREPGLPSRVAGILEARLGRTAADRVIRLAAGAPKEEGEIAALERHLARGFFARHERAFRGRPVYFLFGPARFPDERFVAHHDRIGVDLLARAAREIVAPRLARAAGERRAALALFLERLEALVAGGKGGIPEPGEGRAERLAALSSLLAPTGVGNEKGAGRSAVARHPSGPRVRPDRGTTAALPHRASRSPGGNDSVRRGSGAPGARRPARGS